MKNLTLELPTMYGDHHVIEVRRLLLEMPGMEDVYASSSFRIVEVRYDETKLSAAEIEAGLNEAGYSGELPAPVETGAQENGQAVQFHGTSFRHTAAYEQTGQVVSFTQKVPYTGRPLWHCPGMGVIEMPDKETTDG